MAVYPKAYLMCAGLLLCVLETRAVTTEFFNSSQSTNLVTSGLTSDTFSTEGYVFTYTRDKLFTGGVGLTNPIGRYVRIAWPTGLQAQAVTSGPNPGPARIDIKRQDGQTFSISSFTAELLANTAGAGGAIEIVPLLNGEDGVPNPYAFNVTGISGNSFTYATPQLTNYEAYKITLYVDFALTSLTVVDASLLPPSLEIVSLDSTSVQISWAANAPGYVLESTPVPGATAWTTVTNAALVNGDRCIVDVAVDTSGRFFRLKK